MLKLSSRLRLSGRRFLGPTIAAIPKPHSRLITSPTSSRKATPAHIEILRTITDPTTRWIFFHPPPIPEVTKNWEDESVRLQRLLPSEHDAYKKKFMSSEAALGTRFDAHTEALENMDQELKKYFLSEGFFWLRSNFPGAVEPHMNVPPVKPTVFDTLGLCENDTGWYLYLSAHDLGVEMYEAVNPRPELHDGGEAPQYKEWLARSSWTDLMAYAEFEVFVKDAFSWIEEAELEQCRSVYDKNFAVIREYQFALEERIARFEKVLEDGLRLGWLRPLSKSAGWLKKLSHRPSTDIGSIWLRYL